VSAFIDALRKRWTDADTLVRSPGAEGGKPRRLPYKAFK
jgi:hypothetical protein